ncbi:hypothetical protein ACWT_1858 [Actinoplanes sp. SE50]|nr:hypothetical protein ACPL_1980 [Actinoplanes sp. SE50/110]ATO81273.1 hypothetical protein ACWT_1858 [Actinoplanes sp. SE50]SLL98680.1 hypothetical protein ACSP50_1907 [Actinoplanes sp. SE50/110]
MPRQLLWFMLVGALSTVLQTIVYVSVRDVLAATWASWLALLVVTPANTEAHRRITFNVKTTAVARLHGEAGLTSVVVYLANLAVAPWFAGIAGPHPAPLTESLILAVTGSLIGGARYVILRGWVFAARRHTPVPSTTAAPKLTDPRAAGLKAAGAGASGTGDLDDLDTVDPGALVTADRGTGDFAVGGLAPEAPPSQLVGAATSAGTAGASDDRRRNAPRHGRPPRIIPGEPAAPHSTAQQCVPGQAADGSFAGTLPLAALACLGTMAPIPAARLCLGQPGTGVLNQRPPGRLRTWHRNRRRHLTARS